MDVIGIINSALRGLYANLCEVIYPLIATLYELFTKLGTQMYVDDFEIIYNKISLIIGIFMVFRLSFWLIEALINPDTINDKDKKPGNIIIKVLVSVVLLATTPTLFKTAFDIQKEIVESNIIENIIALDSVSDATSTGKFLSAELFSNFYTSGKIEHTDGSIEKFETTCTDAADKHGTAYDSLLLHGKLDINNECLSKKYKDDNDMPYEIDFNGLMAVAVGAVVAWMMIMYCISLGARYFQLIFLQIIAPIPIMCNLAPGKDNMFSKWIKQCATTYLDLFIRLVIINFVMLLCNMLLNNDNNIVSNIAGESDNWAITVFLILGLLIFAKKVPDLIQELLPKGLSAKASGDFGLSLKKRTDSTLARMGTYGIAGAAVTGAVGFLGGRGTGRVTGMLGGMARGLTNGAKSGSPVKNLQSGIKQQTEANKRKIDLSNNGSSFWGRTEQRMANALGFQGPAEKLDNEISAIDKEIETYKGRIAQKKRQSVAYKEISNVKSNMENRAESKLLNESYDKGKNPVRYNLQKQLLEAKANIDYLQQTGANPEQIVAAQMNYNSTLKKVKEDYITNVINGTVDDKAMKSMLEHMKNVVYNDKDKSFEGFSAFDGTSVNLSNYNDLSTFEGEATTKNNDITEGTDSINEAETAIKSLEDEKTAIKSREDYGKAQADRNAVGGHSGKK